MPFKLFQSHKKTKVDKSATTCPSQLPERKSEESLDSDHKTSNKRVFHIFSSSKSSSQVQLKNADKSKMIKSSDSLLHQKTKSLTHLPFTSKGCGHSPDSNHHSHGGSLRQTRKVTSYSTFDNVNHERRLLEIAQLDNYMDYLRRTEDEGNMTNRLCCAQVLKMSLLRLEHMHLSSQERISVSNRGSTSQIHSLSNSPSMCSQKRLRHLEAFEGDNSSTQSENKDTDHSVHVTFFSGSDSEGRESERGDSCSEQDSEDNSHVQDNFKKPKLRTGRTPIPVWPRDIEIF